MKVIAYRNSRISFLFMSHIHFLYTPAQSQFAIGSGTKFRSHYWSGGTAKIIGPPDKFQLANLARGNHFWPNKKLKTESVHV